MRGLAATCATIGLALGLGASGCTELVDGRVQVELVYPCRPGQGELGPRMALFCLSVLQGERLVGGPSCASSLPEARLELPEEISPSRVRVEIYDADHVLLLRGASPPVSLVSGEEVRVPVSLAPAQGFGLLWAEEAGCQPLPHPLEGHTATLFPTGHLLLAGSARAELSTGQAALLVDTQDPGVAPLSTPASLHRHQHAAALLDDGRLLLVGGLVTGDGLATQEMVALPGGSELMGPYVTGLDYAAAVQLEALPARALHGRPRPRAAVFFGAQVLVADGENPAEMLLGGGTRVEPVEFLGLPGSPFPPNGRTPGVTPYAAGKALVPGVGTGRVVRLTVEEGTPAVLGEVVLPQAAARDHPRTLHLPQGGIMVLGGLTVGATEESPVVLLDVDGALTPVAVPAGFPGRGFSATLLDGGRVAVAGGVDPATGEASPRTYLLSPAEGGYRVARGPDLRLARALHTATWLPDGRLLLAGGAALGAGADPARSVEALALEAP